MDRLLATATLDECMGAFIHAFKYMNVRALAAPLTDAACDRMLRRHSLTGPLPHGALLVVPVPLHTSRLNRRGYNQAELIARRLAHIAAIPVCCGALRRKRQTGQQVKTTGRAQRRENMLDAFVAPEPSLVYNRHILLVDDVTTTGATLEDCARALKEAGALTVTGFTLAHG